MAKFAEASIGFSRPGLVLKSDSDRNPSILPGNGSRLVSISGDCLIETMLLPQRGCHPS